MWYRKYKNIESIENFKSLKYYKSIEKILVLSIICGKCKNENKQIFEEKESSEISKIIGLIENMY